MITNLATDVPAFTSNAFLVTGDRTVLIDAGANFDVVSTIESHVDHLDAVVLTHTHDDHVSNLDAVTAAFDVDVWGYDPSVGGVDRRIEADERVRLGDDVYRAMYTPGHKDDHLCLYAPEPKVLFSGDLLFQNGGFGRTDLPEGDHETLVSSIHAVLDAIDEDLSVMHPGHGPSVTERPYTHVEIAARAALNG